MVVARLWNGMDVLAVYGTGGTVEEEGGAVAHYECASKSRKQQDNIYAEHLPPAALPPPDTPTSSVSYFLINKHQT